MGKKHKKYVKVCDLVELLMIIYLQLKKKLELLFEIYSALAGRGKPSGSGYYDANNKWIRTCV